MFEGFMTKETWDEVESYFICISECDIKDKECVQVCVEELKDNSEIKSDH